VADHPYSRLTPDVVIRAAEELGYEPDARIFGLNSYENRVYQVGVSGQSSIVIKFYRPERWSSEQILEEHAFATELADLEIPVIPPDKLSNGKTLFEFENFQLAVFPLFIGRPPELDNPDNLLVMGRFVGRIHSVGAQQDFLHRVEISVDRFGVKNRAFLLENDFIPSELIPAYESLSQDLIERIQLRFKEHGPLIKQRIHGDCHRGNILWKDGSPNFVDFDDTMMGPAIQDLWMMLSGDRNQKQGQLLELVEGYNEFCDFRSSELALVESFRTLRIINYSAWLARRWKDPAFPQNFPWFNTQRYWSEHILELREQLALLDEPTLEILY
jgi:Ser/Thr protein kinase RdoA (MazF antagonist)